MQNNTVNRLILKDSDVLLIRVPRSFFQNKESLMGLYANIKKKLLPRTNKIMILPTEIEISVIGSEEVKEYISNIDLWSLWDENGDKVDEI
jgi:hypothetical protein